MVEAGADEVPEEKLLEALELAHGEIIEALRGAGGARAARPASREWLDAELTEELEARARRRDSRSGSAPTASREAGAVVEELVARARRRAHDGLDRGRHPQRRSRCARAWR